MKKREGYESREAFPQSGNGAIAETGVARPTRSGGHALKKIKVYTVPYAKNSAIIN